MNNQLIELKPGMWGIKIDLLELWRRVIRKPSRFPVADVAARFLQLYEDHGIAITQIPRFVPELSLAAMQSATTLLPFLTPEILGQAAAFFGIKREWLEGRTDQLYDCDFCYKQPERLFKTLSNLPNADFNSPLCLLFDGRQLDFKAPREQILVLVLREKVAELNGEEIFRYLIFQDMWNWSYWKCRIQLKAMIRVIDHGGKRHVPLFSCTRNELRAILSGRLVPRIATSRTCELRFPIEDYVLSEAESIHAKETDELPNVLKYITENTLTAKCRRALAHDSD